MSKHLRESIFYRYDIDKLVACLELRCGDNNEFCSND